MGERSFSSKNPETPGLTYDAKIISQNPSPELLP
jgi:hypothetical protein